MTPFLKQLLDKRRKPKDKLTPAERDKALKLRSFIQMLQQGKSPTTAQLRACMTVQEVRAYQEHVQQALEYWSYLYDVPEELHSYANALKAADFASNAKKDDYLAESLYEKAYEILQEVVSAYLQGTLQHYFDRDITYYHDSVANKISADELINAGAFSNNPAEAPRLSTSKSQHVQVQARQKRQAERDAKIEFLQREFDAICYIDVVSSTEAKQRNAEFLKKWLKSY